MKQFVHQSWKCLENRCISLNATAKHLFLPFASCEQKQVKVDDELIIKLTSSDLLSGRK
jgi:hypothetical protein